MEDVSWSKEEDFQLEVLVAKKERYMKNLDNQLTMVIDRFYYSGLSTDSLVHELKINADDMIAALTSFSKKS